jgi:PPE-repeat protein
VNFYSASFRSVANALSMSGSLFRLYADAVLYAPLAGLTGATSPVGGATLPSGMLAGAAESAAGSANKAVLASMGNAGPMGQLSVPRAWAQAVPAAATTSNPLWLSGSEELWEAAPAAGAPGAGPGIDMGQMAAMAAAGMAMRPVVGGLLRVPPRRFKMPRHSGGG